MSFPTAHNYVIENLMDEVFSIEKAFLNPNLLLKRLTNAEQALNELTEVLSKNEFADDIRKTEKETIALLISKIIQLEKSSQEKLSWARQFSDYLQKNTNTK